MVLLAASTDRNSRSASGRFGSNNAEVPVPSRTKCRFGSLADMNACRLDVRLRSKADVIGYNLATRPAFVVCFRVGSHRFL